MCTIMEPGERAPSYHRCGTKYSELGGLGGDFEGR